MATAKKSAAKKGGAKKAGAKSASKGGAKSASKGGASKGASKGGAKKAAAKGGASKGGASKGASKGGAAKSASKGGARGASKSGGRAPNPAFMKPMQPSPALAAIVGNEAQPRSQITSRVWDYIKKNGLQDQQNKRQINADERLRPVFGNKSSVSMFEMTKLVNQHLS